LQENEVKKQAEEDKSKKEEAKQVDDKKQR
jgi:hypothetical protein